MVTRRKRRSWSDDEKREICQQTMVPGVSIAQVARRYAANANQIHNWLKDERFTPATKAEAEWTAPSLRHALI
ncbi:MAG: transposase [Pseudomonadota bacterium]